MSSAELAGWISYNRITSTRVFVSVCMHAWPTCVCRCVLDNIWYPRACGLPCIHAWGWAAGCTELLRTAPLVCRCMAVCVCVHRCVRVSDDAWVRNCLIICNNDSETFYFYPYTESAPQQEIESWMREAHVDHTEVARVMQRVSSAVSERTYQAYTDEPLTTTSDTLGMSWLRHWSIHNCLK